MDSPHSIPEYISAHKFLEQDLLNLHDIFTNAGLRGEIVYGEPVYFKEDNKVLGFRAFEHDFSIWFFNGLSDGEFLKLALTDAHGVKQLHFKKGDELTFKAIKKHVDAAVNRAFIRLENKHVIKNQIQDNINASQDIDTTKGIV